MISTRGPWSWSPIWPGSLRRRLARPGPVGVECLESRFLFAGLGLGLGPIATVEEGLTTGASLASEIVPLSPSASGSGDPATLVDGSDADAASGSASPGGRVDLSVLDAGPGQPEVQVAIRWGDGADPTEGILDVLDASGAVLYRFPLAEVVDLQAALPIPDGPDGTFATDSLQLGLTIARGAAGSGDPGTYQLSLAWQSPASAPIPAATSASGAGSVQPATAYGVSVPPPARGLTSVGSLPTPDESASATTMPNDGSPDLGGSPASLPLLAGAPPVTPEGVAAVPPSTAVPIPVPTPAPTPTAGNPGGVASGVAPFTPLAPAPAASGGSGASPSPIAAAPGTASGAGDRGQPTYVGPLPFGAPTPDGGVFARSFARSASIEVGAAGRGMPIAAVPVLGTLVQPALGVEVAWFALWDPNRGTAPLLRSPIGPALAPEARSRSRTTSIGEERAVDSSSAGLAFLPPLATLARLATPTPEPTTTPDAPRYGPRAGLHPPVGAVVAALGTSTALLLRLGGPGWIRALAALRAARTSRGSKAGRSGPL